MDRNPFGFVAFIVFVLALAAVMVWLSIAPVTPQPEKIERVLPDAHISR